MHRFFGSARGGWAFPWSAVWAAVMGAALPACTCSAEQLPERPKPTSAHPATLLAAQRCKPGSAEHTLRAAGEIAALEESSDLFAVELGSPLVHDGGFLVPWMSGDGTTSSAGLTSLSPDLSQSRTTSLGAVHWNAAPPRAILLGQNVLVVVPDADASGDGYRAARVVGDKVSWGAELDGSNDDSTTFDLAATQEAALLVWDDYYPERGLGVVRAVLLDHTAQLKRDLGRLSPLTSDAESPRLAAHETGYWLAWVSVQLERGAASESESTSPSEGLEPTAMRASERWIEVLLLDHHGRAVSEAMTISSRDAMVQSFDLQAAQDGSLLLSWREDFSNAGTSGGQVFVARLTRSGSLERHAIAGKALGGTLPTLLLDPQPEQGSPHAWLTLEAAGGDSALAALSPVGAPLQVLEGELGLGVAAVLGARKGQLLLAKPKGRDIVFSLAKCGFAPAKPGSDAGTSSITP